MPRTREGVRAFTDQWGKGYAANPRDKAAALNYARGLRTMTLYAQAVAVLQNLAIHNPDDENVLGAYGKALADAGRLQEAAEVLAKAHTPDRPNWSILSSQGAVADQLGHHANAQKFYIAALKIAPGEPSVLSNLGLSYALTRNLPLAEQTLRQANASPRADARVRQNLALVLALEGKFAEAEQLERRDLSPADAAANVSAIRQMIAQSDTWRQIRRQKPQAPQRQRLSANR
jgi:Flp pilus assembly protein TadD